MEKKRKKSEQSSEDVVFKSKRKVEMLRRRLEKEEKRAAEVEADVYKNKSAVLDDNTTREAYYESEGRRKRKRSVSDIPTCTLAGGVPAFNVKPSTIISSADGIPAARSTVLRPHSASPSGNPSPQSQTAVHEPVDVAVDLFKSMSKPPTPDDEGNFLPANQGLDDPNPNASALSQGAVSPAVIGSECSCSSVATMSDSSSIISSMDYEDLTSSSGSSSSESDSEDNGPDQASSKRRGPVQVAPPMRIRKNSICPDFLNRGRCRRGNQCTWLHELPKRGIRNVPRREVVQHAQKRERVSLYQRVSHCCIFLSIKEIVLS